MEINIKPMPINSCWQGRRYRTPEYKDWMDEILWLLKGHPKVKKPYSVEIEFYQSANQDIDSGIKPFLDALTKSGIIEDDRYIKELNIKKIVSKERKINFKVIHI